MQSLRYHDTVIYSFFTMRKHHLIRHYYLGEAKIAAKGKQ
jgi:hypothetical protein